MLEKNNKVPEGILVIEDFLSQDLIKTLRYYADGQIGVSSRVETPLQDGRIEIKRIDGFSSDYIPIMEIEKTVEELFNRVFKKIINDHFETNMEWYEYPHILRYRKGGNYRPHADADNWDEQAQVWKRHLDRDYSAIIYFNDEFEGGGLYFPLLNYRLQPKSGMLVCFPSDGRFAHTAEPVIKGNRYAIVSWGASIGSERVRDKVPERSFYLSE